MATGSSIFVAAVIRVFRHDSLLLIKNYGRSALFLFTVCGVKTHKVAQDARSEYNSTDRRH